MNTEKKSFLSLLIYISYFLITHLSQRGTVVAKKSTEHEEEVFRLNTIGREVTIANKPTNKIEEIYEKGISCMSLHECTSTFIGRSKLSSECSCHVTLSYFQANFHNQSLETFFQSDGYQDDKFNT